MVYHFDGKKMASLSNRMQSSKSTSIWMWSNSHTKKANYVRNRKRMWNPIDAEKLEVGWGTEMKVSWTKPMNWGINGEERVLDINGYWAEKRK